MVPGRRKRRMELRPAKDEKKRTYPDLVPWDDLPEREREKNLAMIRQIPVLLARIGFQIERAADRSEMLDL
jgi:hypothetical protein